MNKPKNTPDRSLNGLLSSLTSRYRRNPQRDEFVSRPVEGYVDLLSRKEAIGWAWYPTETGVRVAVEAVLDDHVLGASVAEEVRPDLLAAGIGDGQHGFRISFDRELTREELPAVRFRPTGSPAAFPVIQIVGMEADALAPPADPAADPLRDAQALQALADQNPSEASGEPAPTLGQFPEVLINSRPVEGYVDLLSRKEAIGWAWHPTEAGTRVAVEAVLDGHVLGTSGAEEARPDLLTAGIGDGQHGFRIGFDRELSREELPTVRFRPVGSPAAFPVIQIVGMEADALAAPAEPPADDLRDGQDLQPTLDPPAFDADSDASAESTPAIGQFPEALINSRPVEGYVDFLTRSEASGWAWYPTHPQARVEVEAILGDEVLGLCSAEDLRPDLLDAGIGDGLHGFRISFERELARHELIAVRFRPGGSTAIFPIVQIVAIDPSDLLAADRALQEAAQAQPAEPAAGEPGEEAVSAQLAADSSLAIEGFIDHVSRTYASGWVWRPAAPDEALEVHALLNGRVVGSTLANQFRPDLQVHGKGTGRYGFTVAFELPPHKDLQLDFKVLIQPSNTLTGNAPPPPPDATEVRYESRGSLDQLIADHERYTHPGPEFEAFDPGILQRIESVPAAQRPLVIAFYLPQFHAIRENDVNWGKGFTEWRQLPRGMSRFPGHYQPRIPRDLGFYNLNDLDALAQQAAMAKSAGIEAFAYYYYWFNGKRVLERPLEALLAGPVDMPFMLIWANENWTKTWDGSESDVLLRQDYRPEDEEALLADWARHMRDARYVRLDGRPLFVIYNPDNIPDAAETIARWRNRLKVEFELAPLILMAQTFNARDPRRYGLDGAIEFPPHKLAASNVARPPRDAYSESFRGTIIPYTRFAAASLAEEPAPFPLIKTIVPSWDNDARRPNRGLTLEGVSPQVFQKWLAALLRRAIERPTFGRPIVAINAWNEWAEAAYLEPDVHFGSAFLNATARASVEAVLRPEHVGSQPADAAPSPLKLSVVLPSFNHGRYLRERLASVLNQTRRPDEIVFLDDCSSDDSVAIAREMLEASGVPFQLVVNDTNSGSVFKQWIKGLALASHPLIWIAETDDSADPFFLDHLLPSFDREDVLAAFGRVSYVDEHGNRLDDLNGYYDGLADFSWEESITLPAFKAFANDFAVKNVIPNASALVFRKPVLSEAEVERLLQYRFAGDWYFYALLLRGGSLAYVKDARSYFRKTRDSASRSRLLSDAHLDEHRMVLADLRQQYDIGDAAIGKHAKLLADLFPAEERERLVEAIHTPSATTPRLQAPLRIAIAAYSFEVGGGEVLPIELANALKARGHHVTYVIIHPINEENRSRSIRLRLRGDIPVIHFDDIEHRTETFFQEFGIQFFNSHNVTFENILSFHQYDVRIPFVASLHGGYETVPHYMTDRFLDYVSRNVDTWLYLSTKNLGPIQGKGEGHAPQIRSFNAVRTEGLEWIDRAAFRREHDIPDDAFVMIICSRAIEGKGWDTSIDTCLAVQAACPTRPIHLVLIGDGPIAPDLKLAHRNSPQIHFMGFVQEPLRFFHCFDMAIFPSVYAGETLPLFLLECLAAGLPIVSSDIGEIPVVLGDTGEGAPGLLVSHVLPREPLVQELTAAVISLVNDDDRYAAMSANARKAAGNFTMDRLADLYEQVFTSLIVESPPEAASEAATEAATEAASEASAEALSETTAENEARVQ